MELYPKQPFELSHKDEVKRELFEKLKHITGMECVEQSKNMFVGVFSQHKLEAEIKELMDELDVYYKMIPYSDFILMYFGWLSYDHLPRRVTNELIKHFFDFDPKKCPCLVDEKKKYDKNYNNVKKQMINSITSLRKYNVINDMFVVEFHKLLMTTFTGDPMLNEMELNKVQKRFDETRKVEIDMDAPFI